MKIDMTELRAVQNLSNPSPIEELRGVVTYAVVAPYKGEGDPVLILHEARAGDGREIEYGFGRHWVFPLTTTKAVH